MPLSSTLLRGGRTAAFLATGILLASTFAGCSSGSSSSSSESDGTKVLAADCRNVDLSAIKNAASEISQAELDLRAAGTSGPAFASATVVFLNKGSVFFSTMATTLGTFFNDLAKATDQSDLANIINDFSTTADEFTVLSAKIKSANTVTAADIAAIMEVNTRFDKFAVAVGSGSPSGDMLKEIPDCKTFLRELDLATQAISAADGTDELDGAN
jgi:hypothetical protein